MNQDSKCFLSFLRDNNLLVNNENVFYAPSAFKIHGVISSIIQEHNSPYSSKEDFFSKVNLVDVLIQEQKNVNKTLDKKQTTSYTNTTGVQAPTSVEATTTTVPVPACTRMSAEQMLDRWMIQE